MHFRQLCAELDEYYRIKDFKDMCPNGLQVEGKGEVRKAATAVTASVATIEEAVRQEVDVLVVHHGMFWNQDSYVVKGPKKQKLELLLTHGISLLAYHLPMDAHTECGNNWKAAIDMGWQNLEPFGEYYGQFIGVKGQVDAVPRQQFQQSLEKYYNHQAHAALGGKETISTAVLISGGAYKSIPEVAQKGIDCFITGNFDEPAWHHAFEEQINFFALGHSATERVGPIALAEEIRRRFQIPCTFIDIANPF